MWSYLQYKRDENMKNTMKIKKNYEFNYSFNKGKLYLGKYIKCFYLKNNKNKNFIGIAVSSKQFNAVKRNKVKRIIREAYTNIEKDIVSGNTFVFLWKKKIDIENCKFELIRNDMKKMFKNIGILNE